MGTASRSDPRILIRGDGIAACCCAHLLHKAGIAVTLEPSNRSKVPALMLSGASQSLICDVFAQRDLFHDAPRVEKRVVVWGLDGKALPLPHSAVIISEERLSQRVRPNVPAPAPLDGDPIWTIHSAPPLPPSTEHRFGTRIAAAVQVNLKEDSDARACWIEGLESGWLFMIPAASRSDAHSAWLLAVGGPTESLLAQSRLISDQIAGIIRATAQFPAFPRISDPLCGSNWLACGTTAMSFDPLCGDGTGHAVREAILAAAVVRAALAGEARDGLLEHYRARLVAGFYRHLELCREFYTRGRVGPWWDQELSHLLNGLDYCKSAMINGMRFRYQLTGFDLHRIANSR